ncbi:hypothetical protein [Nonomuraea sp. NPDC052265]|uniref:hypothetical protein n=1 Tax=Nonomuraea sp. NPDC052265 TaxID=3364374 RepID=UPI0037C5716E
MSLPRCNGVGRQATQVDTTLRHFYTTVRAGAVRLSDGGGPFGFDVMVALLVDDLLTAYRCDAIIETGCFLGDTTAYLAHRYPDLPVRTCDINSDYAAFTRRRLAGHPNVRVDCQDSPDFVTWAAGRYRQPLFFLDAHWGEDWPLRRELAAVARGVVLIHDFDVGHPRFAYDTYDGLVCGPQVLALMLEPPPMYFTPDPNAAWPLPCLQVGRRAGVGVVPFGLDPGPLYDHPALLRHELHPEEVGTP